MSDKEQPGDQRRLAAPRAARGPRPRSGRSRVARATVSAVISLACGAVGISLTGGTATAQGRPARAPVRPSQGCGAQPAAAPGQQTLLLGADGVSGWYVREVPESYNGKAALPLVVDLHGYEEPASLQVTISGLGQFGESHHFVTVTPQVQNTVPMWDSGLSSPDMAWFGSLLHSIESTLCIDRNRVYVTGYSNGAFFTSAIACRYASVVAAVAPVAGIQAVPGCHPSRPVPVVAFHGTADPFVSYSGGLGPAALALPSTNGSGQTIGQQLGAAGLKRYGRGPSVPRMTAEWARRNGCPATPAYVRIASDVTLIRYSCPSNADVELYRIQGGGHAWPGSAVSRSISSVIGRTTFSISADAVMWGFFQAHPLTAHD